MFTKPWNGPSTTNWRIRVSQAASLAVRELRSTLEDWILLGLKLTHPLPVIGGIDLNEVPTCELVATV
jgi:hypothetical protein